MQDAQKTAADMRSKIVILQEKIRTQKGNLANLDNSGREASFTQERMSTEAVNKGEKLNHMA